jgi:hypothetical protein
MYALFTPAILATAVIVAVHIRDYFGSHGNVGLHKS